jgi:hypothetical protein
MKIPPRLIRGQVRPDRESFKRFASLRWAALPVVDRRWTAPMAATALGFGLFVGVAVGPGTQVTQGAPGTMTVQVPQTPPADQTAAAPPAGDGPGGGKPEHGGAGGGAHPGDGSSTPPPAPSPPVEPPTSPPVTSPPPAVTSPPVTSTTNTTTTTATQPTDEAPKTLSGTVVHINPAADSYAIADDGKLVAIHSHHPPNLGKSIEVEAKVLANGTYTEVGNRSEHGDEGQATFTGTVSFSDTKQRIYTVSAPGVSVLVRGGASPAVGDTVEVRVRITDNASSLPVVEPGEAGCGDPPALPKPPRSTLEQVSLNVDSAASSTGVEGIVEGVCGNPRKLIVSADDIRESGHDVAILVPKEFELGRIDTGDVLRLTTSILGSGSLQLETLAGDKGGEGADDSGLVQP